MRKLYEEGLGDVLWAVENGRTRRPYRRVVVKMKTRKKKRKNGKPMTHAAKVAGWDKAAIRLTRQQQENKTVRSSTSITMEEATQMDACNRSRAQRTSGKRLTHNDNLLGADFDLLLVWQLSPTTSHGIKCYHCLCACGRVMLDVAAGMLLNGRKKDCGCRLKAKRRQQRQRKQQKLAQTGRKRSHWKRHWGAAA